MIFTVSCVCLAYVLGITISTILVRRNKLVGTGFFWLMYSTSAGFAFIALIASSGTSRWVAIVVLLATLSQLIHSIIRRDHMKTDIEIPEVLLFIFATIATAANILVIVNEHTNGFAFFRESARCLVGGMLLGSVTTAMLLGHWYLVQPGLDRSPIARMCKLCMVVVCVDVVLWLLNPSMISVFRGTISDGWNGTLGYMWLGSVVATAVLLYAARKALSEKSYSAVMATTGLLYLAILMANGVELIPRAIFS